MGSLIERLTYIYLLCIAREPFKWPIVFKSSACSISLAFIQIRLYCFSFRLVFDSLFGEFTKWRSLPFRCYVKRTYGARNMKICVFWDESAQSSVETYRLREKKKQIKIKYRDAVASKRCLNTYFWLEISYSVFLCQMRVPHILSRV